MRSFIAEVIDDLNLTVDDFEHLVFILPSKRAGTFLKKAISKSIAKTIISPSIFSIEEFIEQVSGLTYINNTEQLFKLYETYLTVGDFEKESFESFLKWGQTLLQDFNEVDRYLIDGPKLFSNLSSIQELNHWSLTNEKTELMKNYLHFWNHLGPIYSLFNSKLLQENVGHQGLVYRTAAENIGTYLSHNSKNHVFIGFNALNNAESEIIQTILDTTKSTIYFDIDSYFLEDPVHDAGLFIRKHTARWDCLKKNSLKGLSNYYLSKKKIKAVGVPKNISQSKYVGNILKEIQEYSPDQLKNTALILADENLLNPILNSIPETIDKVNITMGQQLGNSPIASFFESLFEIHEQRTTKGWFYKDFIRLLSHPVTSILLNTSGFSTNEVITTLKTKNWAYITKDHIASVLDFKIATIPLLFGQAFMEPKQFIANSHVLILELKDIYTQNGNNLALEQLYKFHTLFNQLQDLLFKYDYITNLKGLKTLYLQLLSSETLDFKGDPLEGLQVMGMLESRNLDFETVILTSVNEGILPSGKSNNSFIPFDLKIAHGLPTYKEKDAIYTYHFYRLLQRAKNIHLIYNTEPDVLEGGEKSRLITQILTDPNRKDVTEIIASPKVTILQENVESIRKTEDLISLIRTYAAKGFSPSSLSNYIRNPVDFYKQNLLGINDIATVEETVAANTFGTIAHDTLEELYTPFIGHELSKEGLEKAKSQIEDTVQKNFKKTYLDGDFSTGKNLISYYVIIKYIQNFIEIEIEGLSKCTTKVIALEQNLSVILKIPGIDFPVVLKGKLDRIDEVDGVVRIIDYKTGRVQKSNVEIKEWDSLVEDYQYSKAFQLLCYSYMYNHIHPSNSIQAGIISLKNLKAGTQFFAKKESSGRATKEQQRIDSEIISEFERCLFHLISEITNPEIDFLEKEI